MRVTNQMLINTVLRDLFNNNARMIRVQDQIATGRNINNPDEDPLIADQVMNLETRIARSGQYIRNGNAGSSYLSLADSSLGDVNNLAVSARTLAVTMANDTNTASMRGQAAGEVNQMLEQAVEVSNRRFRGRYIFGGLETTTPPFEITANGVLYHGDMEHLNVWLGESALNQINVNGVDAFGAFGAQVIGALDLSPALDFTVDGTKLQDLNGGQGVSPGSISISYGGGPGATVDLSAARSIEDIRTLIEDATDFGGGPEISVSGAGTNSLILTNNVGVGITVAEVNQNTTANDLGILGTAAGAVLTGSDVDPLMTKGTKMSSLLGGGVDLASGFVITNGAASATVTAAELGGAVGDLLTFLNNSAADVHAAINDTGTGINIFSRLNGPTMTITENGGTTAADMGILEVAGVRADNLFTSLLDLGTALSADNQAGISASIGNLDRAIDGLLISRAEVGARVQRFETTGRRQSDEQYNLTKLVSEANDLDYSRAVLDFQSLRNIMEAALSMAAQTMPRSLADFL